VGFYFWTLYSGPSSLRFWALCSRSSSLGFWALSLAFLDQVEHPLVSITKLQKAPHHKLQVSATSSLPSGLSKFQMPLIILSLGTSPSPWCHLYYPHWRIF